MHRFIKPLFLYLHQAIPLASVPVNILKKYVDCKREHLPVVLLLSSNDFYTFINHYDQFISC